MQPAEEARQVLTSSRFQEQVVVVVQDDPTAQGDVELTTRALRVSRSSVLARSSAR